MATHRIPILNQFCRPDNSGNVFWEPFSVKATNDVWDHGVWVFNDTATRLLLHGNFMVPQNYVGTASIILPWSASAITGNVVWDFDYRAVGGDDAESLDQAGVQSDTNDIQSRLPAALVGGRMDSNLGAISTSATAADNLERSTLGIVTGTVGTGSTTTSIVTSALSPAASVADQFKGRIVTFDANTTTAALRGQSTDITANTNTGTLTVTALTTAPASGDKFTIT